MARRRRALPIPDGGPCSGHRCDDCASCARGRCCRRDDPDYQLPKLGEWDGEIFGRLGVVARPDGDLAQCHACGESFKSVLLHAVQAHDLTSDEYRAIFGFWKSAQLTGAASSKRRRAHALRRLASGDLVPIREHVFTAEQASAVHAQRTAKRREWGVPEPVSQVARRVVEDEDARRRWYEARGVPYLTPEQRAEIRALRPSSSSSELAREYGVSRGQIDWLCGRLHVDGARLPPERIAALARRNAEIREARAAGESVRSLAARYGLSEATIRLVCKRTDPA